MKKLLFILAAAAIVLTGCKKDEKAIRVSSVSATPATATLEIGATQQLTAEVLPANAENKGVEWTSDKAAVATVSAGGLVTAISAGSATITVATLDGDHTDTVVITVNAAQQPQTPAVSDYFTVAGSTAVEGALPAKTDDSAIAVAMANVDGDEARQIVTVTSPVALSKIYVKVNGVDGYLEFPAVEKTRADFVYAFTIALAQNVAKTFKIEVSGLTADEKVVAPATADVKTDEPYNPGPGEKPVTGVSLNKFSAQVTVGETFEFAATVAPADATNQKVSWSIGDSSIATVSNAGVVTGIKAGATVLTVTTDEGKFKATAAITVIAAPNPTEVKSIRFNKTTLAMDIADEAVLKIVTDPAGLESSVTLGDWKTSDAAIATVTSQGVVTAIDEGTATIYVWTADNKFKAECKVTVGGGGASTDNITIMDGGSEVASEVEITMQSASKTFTAKVTNAGSGEETPAEVTWESSDTGVATVSNGAVSVVGIGTTTITATSDTNGEEASFDVVVPVTAIELSSATAKLTHAKDAAATTTLTATVKSGSTIVSGDALNGKTVTWESSASGVATVSAGTVTSVAKGTSNITAKMTGAGSAGADVVSTACVVTVYDTPFTAITLNESAKTLIIGASDGTEKTTLSVATWTDDTKATVAETVAWSSSSQKVLVDASSGEVTLAADAADGDTATITATVSNAGAENASPVTAICTITVSDSEE